MVSKAKQWFGLFRSALVGKGLGIRGLLGHTPPTSPTPNSPIFSFQSHLMWPPPSIFWFFFNWLRPWPHKVLGKNWLERKNGRKSDFRAIFPVLSLVPGWSQNPLCGQFSCFGSAGPITEAEFRPQDKRPIANWNFLIHSGPPRFQPFSCSPFSWSANSGVCKPLSRAQFQGCFRLSRSAEKLSRIGVAHF